MLDVDIEQLQQFEQQLDPTHPEAGPIPVRVLGYGEISTVFAIGDDDLAYKRMPIFQSQDELNAYEIIYDEYNRLLVEEVGIRLPDHARVSVPGRNGLPVLYLVQQRLNPDTIGHKVIHHLDDADTLRLVRRIWREAMKVWEFNQRSDHIEMALDGQISNWSVAGFDASHPRLDEDIQLLYLDTSTPLFRVDGVEQINGELFLRSAPSFLAWVLRRFFLEDVIARYYDFHRVIVDFIANFYKEQRGDLVPQMVAMANDFFENEAAALTVEPITLKEVQDYYREDAFIWRFYQSARRLDRWLHTVIMRKPYPYILPGPVNR
jgi:hypothetical protein